jgi:uncharacterized membrane protein HdeD (DUF308 family)
VYLGVYWLLCGLFELGGLYLNRVMSGWQLASTLLSIAAGVVAIGFAAQGGNRFQDALILTAGGFGLVIGIFDVIRGIRGGGWVDWMPGTLNTLFGLILLALYVLAPPLVVVSIVVCAVIGGLVEIALAVRGKPG